MALHAAEKEKLWGDSTIYQLPAGPLGAVINQQNIQFVKVALPGVAGSRVWRLFLFVEMINGLLQDVTSVISMRWLVTIGVGSVTTTFRREVLMVGPSSSPTSHWASVELEVPARTIQVVQEIFNYSNVIAGQGPAAARVGAMVSPQQPMYETSHEDGGVQW